METLPTSMPCASSFTSYPTARSGSTSAVFAIIDCRSRTNGMTARHFGELFTPALEDFWGRVAIRRIRWRIGIAYIARSAQVIYEDAFFHLIRKAHARYDSTNLALAGGCAMNSVANGKVRRVTPFRRSGCGGRCRWRNWTGIRTLASAGGQA